MKRVFFGLFLCLILVSGCNTPPKYDKAKLEQQIKTTYNQQLQQRGDSVRCTDVKLVQDGDNQYRFTGYAAYTDGSQKDVTATIDPNTNEVIY